MNYAPPHILIQLSHRIQAFIMYLLSVRKNSVDFDQLASEKPADPNLHCIRKRIFPVRAW